MTPVSPKAPIGRREKAAARRLIAAIQAMNLHVIDGDTDPRVLDLQLAEALKFARPRAIRQLIERYREELERYGPLHFRSAMVDAVCVNQRQQHGRDQTSGATIARALCSGIQDRARETLHETLQLKFAIESRMKNFSAWNWLDN